jgi:hypothetical protein
MTEERMYQLCLLSRFPLRGRSLPAMRKPSSGKWKDRAFSKLVDVDLYDIGFFTLMSVKSRAIKVEKYSYSMDHRLLSIPGS